MRQAKRKRLPDLFEPNITRSVLLLLLERGSLTSKEWREARVARGGSEMMTNSFKRYFVGARPGTYVPDSGSHEIVEQVRTNSRAGLVYKWVGSEGDTFEQRAAGWLARLDPKDLDATLLVLETAMLAEPAAPKMRRGRAILNLSAIDKAAEWFAIATAESLRRAKAMRMPVAA